MGIAYALAAMVCFASNILVTRYALARMPLESGFLVVLAVNILFPAALFAVDLAVRAAPWSWDWDAAFLFALGGVIGTYVGRRMLFDAVRLLGPARASVFHSTAPIFALIGAWVVASEKLGGYELAIMVVVLAGLLCTQPRATYMASNPDSKALRFGILAGFAAVAGFGFSNVFRGVAVRVWDEPVLGAVIASATALAFQLVATRGWPAIALQLRTGDRAAWLLYAACGVTTSLGSIFLALSMQHMEIALAVLVVHTTPIVIFPVSVFLLKNREELSARTVAGALLVLCGIAALSLR
jgi:drug/metabolite transporter (DMT)-like permease